MQRLARLFPRSRFVLMIRDGRAVADSIVSGHVTIRGFDVETHRGALRGVNAPRRAVRCRPLMLHETKLSRQRLGRDQSPMRPKLIFCPRVRQTPKF